MHNQTTEEQAKENRDRRNGKSAGVEATTTTNDANDVVSAWRVVEWFMTLPDPTSQQAALVSVVTGAMTGAFAVWMNHEGNAHQTQAKRLHSREDNIK